MKTTDFASAVIVSSTAPSTRLIPDRLKGSVASSLKSRNIMSLLNIFVTETDINIDVTYSDF